MAPSHALFALAFGLLASCQVGAPGPAVDSALAWNVNERRAQAHRAWAKGLDRRARGDFAAAVESFLEAAELDPTSVIPRREIGRMLLAVGHNEEALLFLVSARREGDFRGLLELSICHRRLGNYAGAISVLTELHSLRPYEKLPLLQLHALLLLEGRAHEGLALFKQVVDRELPAWSFSHEAHGDFQLRTGSLEGALQSYVQASKLGGLTESLERKTALALRRIATRASLPGSDPAPRPGLGLPASSRAPETSGRALRGGRP